MVRENDTARLLGWSAMLTFGGYLFIRLDQGHGWGYRYFHSAWGVLPILAGCAMTITPFQARKLTAFFGATTLLGIFLLVPFQMNQISSFIATHINQLQPAKRPGNNVYFIKPGYGSYLADMVQADPFLRSPDLLLASRGDALDQELMRQNWPRASKLGNGYGVQQWYLGPVDQRRTIPGLNGKHLVPTFVPDGVKAALLN